MALDEYKTLLKLERNSAEYNMKAGICYLRTNIDKKKALFYLKRAHEQEKYDKEVPYFLGLAYTMHYQFDKAKEAFLEYKDNSTRDYKDLVEKRIKDCEVAKELMKDKKNITYENMGSQINSKFPDYYPFISGDETTLAFTSRRKEKGARLEFDGYYPSDVYITTFDGDEFSRAQNAGRRINKRYNDQSTGITPDGEIMILYSDYDPAGELFFVKKKGAVFYDKDKIEVIDEEKALESAACITPDRNTIIYSSNKDDGKGKLDLWMVRKLPNGEWGLPQNLGDKINTQGDEDFPSVAPDGKTLYFSSNGLPGMGGFDLYKSTWDPQTNTWQEPVNLGHPLNTPDDERSISITNDNKHGYISALRKEGMGDLDVYRVIFEAVEVKPALFSIKLTTGDTTNRFVTADMFTVYDQNDNIVGDYSPNENTKAYTVILQPGQYRLEIDYNGDLIMKDMKVNEFMNRMGMIQKIINIGSKE